MGPMCPTQSLADLKEDITVLIKFWHSMLTEKKYLKSTSPIITGKEQEQSVLYVPSIHQFFNRIKFTHVAGEVWLLNFHFGISVWLKGPKGLRGQTAAKFWDLKKLISCPI